MLFCDICCARRWAKTLKESNDNFGFIAAKQARLLRMKELLIISEVTQNELLAIIQLRNSRRSKFVQATIVLTLPPLFCDYGSGQIQI